MPDKITLSAACERLRTTDGVLMVPADPKQFAKLQEARRAASADARVNDPELRPKLLPQWVQQVHVLRDNGDGVLRDVGLWTLDDVEAAIKMYGATEADVNGHGVCVQDAVSWLYFATRED
jgi:hypothetical protein